MGRSSFKKVIALILCAALIFQNSALAYGTPFETVQAELPDVGAYAESNSTTESAIKTTTDSAIQSMMAATTEEIDYDISWYKDEGDNFVLINAKQLRGLAQLVNGTASGTAIAAKNFYKKTITLGNNINLENEEWTPIGTPSKTFAGSLNGGGFTVSGLYINTAGSYLGLFGYIGASAEIKNLTVSGSVTETSPQGSTNTYIGGIVGYVYGEAKLTNLTNKANVTMSRNYAGGIVGYVNGAGVLTNCRNEGNISSYQYAGGIAGYINGAGVLTNCYNEGDIGAYQYAGGIVGSITTGTISSSINESSITGTVGYAGGIAGALTTGSVKNSFSYYLDKDKKAPFGLLGTGSGGTVTNSFYLSETSVAEFKGFARNANAFKYGEVLYYLNGMSEHGTMWKQGTLYPEIPKLGETVSPVYQVKLVPKMEGYKGIEVAFSAEFNDKVIEDGTNGAKSVYVTTGTAVGFTLAHDVDNISVTITGVTPVPTIEPGKAISETVKVAGKDIKIVYALGAVDPGDADISWYSDDIVSFGLSSPGELNGLSYLVNSGKDFSGKTITLNNDIDISAIQSWTPVGSESSPFKGTFNGGGKTVSGLKIGSSLNPVNKDYQGLFGYNAGSVSNLKVKGEIYSTGKYIGGVVGYSTGTLNGIAFTGNVSSSGELGDYVGGVVGYSTGAIGASAGLVFGDASELKDNKVTNPTSSVKGHDYVGGIAGYSTAAISSSKNYGEVSGESRVGGIAGGAVSIIGGSVAAANTNYAPVNVSGDYAGGIVGNHSENAAVSFNVNYGDVDSDGSYAGGIAGAIRGTTAAANNTNNGDVTASGDYVGGIAGSVSNKEANEGTGGAAITTPVNNGAVIGGNYVGGIAGLYRSTSALHTAANNGTVNGGSYVGGIAGAAYGPLSNNSLATGVKNTAAVTGTGDYIGGLGGYLKAISATTRTVSYGYNSASVNGAETSSYVGGIMGRGDGLMEHTYAAGESGKITVAGGTNVGSLAGYIDKSLSINYSYAYANVSGDGKFVGGVKPGVKITYTNSYYIADADDDANAKTAESFFSGEVAWLLGGGDGVRNTVWAQEKGKLPVLVANKPVFKVSIIKGNEPEGSTVTITDGSFGIPGETDGEGKQWVYVTSGEKFKVTTITPGISPAAVYGISFINPLDVLKISSEDDGEKTTSVYSVGPITSNYDGQYIIATDIEPDYKWYDDNPSAEKFTIKNEDELKGLAYLVNGLRGQPAIAFSGKIIELGVDIPITVGNWTPIGTSTAPFQGAFNGNGNKISGLTISATGLNQGLFGYISGNAKVENLTVLNASILSTGTVTGGIVGTAAGNSKLSKLTFGASGDDSNVTGKSQTGGIIGNVAANTVKIEECTNYGSVTGTSNVGGVAGQTAAGTAAISVGITDGMNVGAVSGETNVGGIVGQMGAFIALNRCENKGDVTGTGNSVGGIVGLTGAGSTNPYNKIEACSNSGNISGSYNVGGIAGMVGNYTNFGKDNDATGEFACINSGEISGDAVGTTRAASFGAGGIVGQAGLNINFYYCSNSGEVNGKFSFGGTTANSTVSGVGGIAGLTGTFAKFINNANEGKVNGDIYNAEYWAIAGIGGIVGRASTSSEIIKGINSGEISGYIGSNGTNSIAGMGGLAGVISANYLIATATNAKINDCTNTGIIDGDVTGTGTGGSGTGGILGAVGNGSNITNCSNLGVANGINNVGGITGQAGPNTKHEKCSSMNKVQASGKVCAGGIVGNIGVGSKVENSYNIGDIIITDVPTMVGGVGGITGTNGNSTSSVENSYSIGRVRVVGVKNAIAIGGITGSYSDSNSNNYFYKHNVLVGLSEDTLAVPRETGDEIINGFNMPIQDGAYESGELAWRLNRGHTAKSLTLWGHDTVNNCPTLDVDTYPPVYRFLAEDDEYGSVTPQCRYVTSGSAITMYIAPEQGYTLKSLNMKGSDGKYHVPDFAPDNRTATFSMQGMNLTVSPIFMLTSEIKGGPFNVNFDLNGGIGSAGTQIVDAGKRALEPTEPIKTGYIFAGWYDKSTVGASVHGFLGKDSFDFSTIITEDIELIACWYPENGAIVMFDLNRDAGATGSPQVPMQLVEFENKIAKPADPIWDGKDEEKIIKTYEFTGWYTAKKGGREWNFDDGLKKTDTDGGVLALYARWEVEIEIKDGYDFGDLESLRDLGINVEEGVDYDGYKFTLGANITLPSDWEGIGGKNKPFSGTFDGQGHTVTLNAYVTQPLFHEIGENGYVYDVNVIGDLAGVKREYFGCIASTNKGKIDNCTATLTGSGYAFGEGPVDKAVVCGSIVGKNDSGTVSNCTATLNIDVGGKSVGGIAGQSILGVITDCTLTGGSTIGGYAGGSFTEAGTGGIVGYAVLTKIRDCTVEQGVKIMIPTAGGQGHGGGIVGQYVVKGSGDSGLISNCVNYAQLSILSSYIGGIAGEITGMASGTGTIKPIQVIDCNNYGNVTAGTAAAGGIIGRVSEGAIIEIKNCYNYGDVTNGSGGAAQADAGGILGRQYTMTSVPPVVSIINCGNEGTITDTAAYAGGLVARLGNTGSKYQLYIKDSYNKGEVRGTLGAAGIVAETSLADKVEIENCNVFGNIGDMSDASTTNAGGFIGNTNATASYTISHSYWEGDYTGSKNAVVGGIIGNLATTTGNVDVTDVYWSGSFTDAVPNTFGGIFGNIGSPTGKVTLSNAFWHGDGEASAGVIGRVTDAANVRVSNVYYRLDIPEYADDDAFGTAKAEDSFVSGEVAYLIDGGLQDGSSSQRAEKWTQDFKGRYPVFENGKPVYMLTMSSGGNGSVGIKDRSFIETEDNKSVYFGIKGETVKIDAVPNTGTETEGYKLKSLIVTKLDGEEVYRFDENNNSENKEHEFTMPDSNIIVNAEFEILQKAVITPKITGYSDGAVMTIGNAGSEEVYVVNIGDTVEVSVNILTHPAVEGATSAEYYLKSLTVEFEDGRTLDIAGTEQFEATGNAVVTADIGEKIVFPSPEEPKEEDDDKEPPKEKDPETGGNEDGSGIGDGTGTGTGEGTGGGTDTGTEGNQTGTSETGSGTPVDNSTENKKDDVSATVSTSQQPKNKEVTSAKSEPEEKPEDEQTPPEPEVKEPETPKEPEEPEEEAEEVSSTPVENTQKSMIPPIAAAVAAIVVILAGIYRFVILKKKK